MTFPDIFSRETSEQVIQRINRLSPTSKALWGKMNVGQMLAHCNVMYEMVFTNKHPKPGFFMQFILKSFVKGIVTGEKPYKHNSQTAPAFIIKNERDFETEKGRLVSYIQQAQQLGGNHFDEKESLSFGRLSRDQWNTMFYKHLDHHLQQFNV